MSSGRVTALGVSLPGHRILTCTHCHAVVETLEIPYGYLDAAEFGPYMCGPCAAKVRPA